jgi:hypothetical protein
LIGLVLNGKVSKEQALEGKEKIDRVKPDCPGPFLFIISGSLTDLKEIGCKSVWPVHISPLFRPIE